MLVNSFFHRLILFRSTVDLRELTHLLKVFSSLRYLDIIQASQAFDFGECQTTDKLHCSGHAYGTFGGKLVVLDMAPWAHVPTECCAFKVLASFVRFWHRGRAAPGSAGERLMMSSSALRTDKFSSKPFQLFHPSHVVEFRT